MKDTQLRLDDTEVKNPVLVEGLAGIGHIGKTTVAYLVEHLNAEEIGEIESSHFPPFTLIDDDKHIELLTNTIYGLEREDGRDLVLVEGDAQASTNEGHYEVAETILDLADEVDAHEIVTVGGYGTGDVVDEPDVFGAVTADEMKEKFDGVSFDHEVGQIVGASGLVLGLGENRGYGGVALLGETPGFLLSDPSATEAVLQSLEGAMNLDLDYDDLEDKVQESQDVLEKLQNLKQQQQQGEKENQGGDLGYIG